MSINDDFFLLPSESIKTHWASPENPRAEPGAAATANAGRKGRPNLPLAAGESITLAEEPEGVSGTVRRIWVTISDRSPAMLRGLRLDFYWEGAATPAVSAPFGDFFGIGLGRSAAFESALFASPEGRSFLCFVPMPFRSGMRLVITNETGTDLPMLFYDVNYTVGDTHGPEMLYFHAYWHRESPTTLQQDYEILPQITGSGRFLGVNFGVQADTVRYGRTWWGEGEVKFFLDGDTDSPTLCGTGTEDYIGTGWAQGQYAQAYQGCPVADGPALAYCFYRYHIPDPIWFHSSLRTTIQQIGHCFGEGREWLRNHGQPVYKAGPELIPIDFETEGQNGFLFERQDDWSSCAYLYLDSPVNDLPPLPSAAERITGI
ncbi:MAG: glycoside hydrolase family 172 protein [Armatimonadota bacterium]